MDAFEILVIILSVTLFVFLLLAIILIAMLMRISSKIQHISDTVGDTVDNVQNFTASLSRLASPALLAKIIMQYVQKMQNKKRKEQ